MVPKVGSKVLQGSLKELQEAPNIMSMIYVTLIMAIPRTVEILRS